MNVAREGPFQRTAPRQSRKVNEVSTVGYRPNGTIAVQCVSADRPRQVHQSSAIVRGDADEAVDRVRQHRPVGARPHVEHPRHCYVRDRSRHIIKANANDTAVGVPVKDRIEVPIPSRSVCTNRSHHGAVYRFERLVRRLHRAIANDRKRSRGGGCRLEAHQFSACKCCIGMAVAAGDERRCGTRRNHLCSRARMAQELVDGSRLTRGGDVPAIILRRLVRAVPNASPVPHPDRCRKSVGNLPNGIHAGTRGVFGQFRIGLQKRAFPKDGAPNEPNDRIVDDGS